jgi:hypothetical protein
MHQAMKWIVGAGAMLTLAAQSGALAQNPQPNSPSAAPPPVAAGAGAIRGPFPAPVGHRQPKQSDLPPDTIKKETRGEPGLRELDDKLRICKGC